MGMVPIPVITPLTLSRSNEPVLEPTVPVSRLQLELTGAGEQAQEGYSPSQQHPPPKDAPHKAEPDPPPTDPDHELNLFA